MLSLKKCHIDSIRCNLRPHMRPVPQAPKGYQGPGDPVHQWRHVPSETMNIFYELVYSGCTVPPVPSGTVTF